MFQLFLSCVEDSGIFSKDKGQGKVVPALFFNSAPSHEGVLREWRYSSTHSLTSALDVGEWSASRPGRFTPRKSLWYPLDRRLGGPQGRSGRGSEEKAGNRTVEPRSSSP
jgi:hypothetical protein